MKYFFLIVFGGIVAVASGIILAVGARFIITYIHSNSSDISFSNVATAIISQPIDGTSISGFKRLVSYTAGEEEGLLIAATLSLPRSFVEGISAKSYIVKNVESGKIIAQRDSDRLLPMASITKLVTAVIAKKVYKGDEKIKITQNILDTYGTTGQFRLGENINSADLLYPLLMVSSNDAAEALARGYGRKEFISAMNEFVQSIGAYRTTFIDPSGLSENNRTTSNDLVTIMDWINKNEPEIVEITKLKTKTVRNHTWTNPARFLNWSNYQGGKNGYTEEARQTGVALFEMGKNNLYAVAILGSLMRDDDIVKLLGKIKE